jgi:hypothetical protein
VVKDYQHRKRSYLTENDVVMHIHAKLAKMQLSSVGIQSELRPYIIRGKDTMVLKETENNKIDWVKQNKALEGARIDLALVNQDDHYWESALKKAMNDQNRVEDLRFWRILSYPCATFQAMMEIKIRVNGNLRRIYKDISKFQAIQNENKKCLKFLMILDRCASEKSIEKIENALESISYIHAYSMREVISN